MDKFQLTQEISFPISPHNPYYNKIWRFGPSNSSFFTSIGVGVLKSVFESSNRGLQSQLLRKIREIPAESFESTSHFEGAKKIFKALLKWKKKSTRAPKILAELRSLLVDPERYDVIFSINLVTKALFIAMDSTQAEEILQEEVNIPQESLIRLLCGFLEINLHIVSETKIERIETKQSSPLITLHLEGENYGLMFRTYENSDLSGFPYVLENAQQVLNKKKTEEIIRILVDGFDPSGISSENLSMITVFLENSISDQDLAKTIQQKYNKSVKKSATFVPLCGKEHSLKELYTNCKNNNYYCPCLKKLSPKNIDQILDRKLSKGGARSIKCMASSTNSISSDTYKSLPKSDPSKREDLYSDQSLGAPAHAMESNKDDQEKREMEEGKGKGEMEERKGKGEMEEGKKQEDNEQRKITAENPDNARRLDCKHRGEDPMNCLKHKFCLDCRYETLDREFKCGSCEREYKKEEKEKLWDWLAKRKAQYRVDICPQCKNVSFLHERRLCLTCGEVSHINNSKF